MSSLNTTPQSRIACIASLRKHFRGQACCNVGELVDKKLSWLGIGVRSMMNKLGAWTYRKMKRATKVAITGALVTLVIVAGGYLALRKMFPSETLTAIRKTSPDRKHSAELVTREAGFDVNLVLRVDDAVIYTSPDFAAPAQADFQERIMWDRSGTIVLLEVGGKRLFGYHILEQRPLSPSELFAVQLAPFEDLRFTEDLPTSASVPATQ